MKCPYCGYVWKPKVKNPRSCPRCKRYFFEGHMPERVAEEPVQERLEVPKVKSVTPLPSDSYLECEYCTKRAIVHILGKNVCEDHIVTVIKEKLGSKPVEIPKTYEEELLLPFDEWLEILARSTSDFETMVEIAKREAIRRNYMLPEAEIRRLCELAWQKAQSVVM